jgi:hypothetical protein
LLIVFLVLLSPLAIGPRSDIAAEQVASVLLPETSGNVGERLRIPLDIEDADSVQAAFIEFSFDPLIVLPDEGSLELGAFGQTIQASWVAFRTDNLLRLVFSTADTVGYVGSGTLVTFECELLSEGVSPLSFTDIVLEKLPNIILPSQGVDGSVSVGPAPVEEGSWGEVKHRYAGAP